MKRRYRTADQNWVRERNLAIVLDYLWEAGGPISRTRLTEISGLNKSTVGSLLTQLQTWGLVRESGTLGQRPGRPGVLIDLNPDAGRLIGAEIGVGFVSAIVTDLKANVVWQHKIDIPNGETKEPACGQADVLNQAEQLVQEAIGQATASNRRLLGIGLGVPGLVDHTTGTLLFAPNLGWSNVPLRDMWRRRFGVPVVVENEANAAALGERMLGVARQVDNFVYLSAGVGLGGGLVIDGKLYGGMGGFAGEIGHMTLEPNGPQCKCGNRGCWETLIGPTAIIQKARQAASEGCTPKLLALRAVDGDVNAIRMEHVLQAAAQGEPAIIEDLDEVGRYLGIGIANLINAFNPSLVVLGGMLSLAGPYILPCAQQEVQRRALAAARSGAKIIVSAFKFDACVMGGVSLIVREILSNPTAWQPTPAPAFDEQASFAASVL
ncbi:MAG TPA: ROK family transcriptional regulator [Anaerolineae bacterium]|nr:ROK family transcriptional regulator [Anaerolineae bacterium]